MRIRGKAGQNKQGKQRVIRSDQTDPYLKGIEQTDGLNRGYDGEDDDSHRASSDQRSRSEGQKNAHTPLHGDDHGQTSRTDEKPREQTHYVASS